MKYIVFSDGARDVPVIFPNDLVHADVADALARIHDCSRGIGMNVVAAGTVDCLMVSSVSGESKTLALGARAEDATMINIYDYAHGMSVPNSAAIEHSVMVGVMRAFLEVFGDA